MKPQVVPLQIGDAFAGVVHGAHEAPHFTKPGLQVKSHVVPFVQLPTAFGGGLQVVHALPQRRKPALHAKSQLEALRQTGEAFGCAGHTAHEPPQLVTAAFGTQAWPQRCWPVGQEQVLEVVLQVAPVGHSELMRQPGAHMRVTGLQLKPGAQPPATTQSVGSGVQVPALHTRPELH